MAACRECGRDVKKSDVFCSSCGTKLDRSPTQQNTTTTNGAGYNTGIEPAVDQREQPANQKNDTHATELNTDILGRRIIAVIADTILVSIILSFFLGLLNIDGIGGLVLGYLILYPAYFTIAETKTGRTPGKAALGLKVVSQTGSPISGQQALLRNVIRLVDGLAYYLVGVLIIVVSNRNQRLGDHAANTLVIRAR